MFIDGQVGDMRMEDRNVFHLVKVFFCGKGQNIFFSFVRGLLLSKRKWFGLTVEWLVSLQLKERLRPKRQR